MIFVTGCHRSGTSLAASLINEVFGKEIPSPGTEMKPSLDNPRGFNETVELARVNDLIIQGFGYAWDKPWLQKPDFNSSESTQSINSLRSLLPHTSKGVWIDKDPRLCLTLDIFSRIFLEVIPTLAIIRNPFAVSRSLALRNGFSVDKGLAIWTSYNFLLFSSSNIPASYIFYEDIIERPSVIAEDLHGFIKYVLQKYGIYANHLEHGLEGLKSIEAICRRSYSDRLNRSSVESDFAEYSPLSQTCSKAWLQLRELGNSSSITNWHTKILEVLYPCVMEVLRNYGRIFVGTQKDCASLKLSIDSPKSTDTSKKTDFSTYARENQQLESEIEDLFSELIRMQSALADAQKDVAKYKRRATLNREMASRLIQGHKTASGLISRLAT